MTRYTHIEMPGIFGNKGVMLPDGTYRPKPWWRTSSPQQKVADGFRVADEPEPEPPTFEQVRDAKLVDLDDRRWRAEVGGITVNGVSIRTDEAGQTKLDGAIMLFEKDPSLLEVDWEAQPGVWVTLSQEEVVGLGVAVGRHIQATFTHKRALCESINAAETIEDLDAIDIEAGWT